MSPSEIALHKAGIIKKEVPVLIGDINGDALDVIVDVAKRKNTKITRIGTEHNNVAKEDGTSFDYKTYENLFIPNLSKTNVKNACLVIDAIDLLMEKYPVSEESLKEGLKEKLPNGRFEFLLKVSLLFSLIAPTTQKRLRN